MIAFRKQYPFVSGSVYVFKFSGESVPEKAVALSTTGLFDSGAIQSIRLVVDADMSIQCNKPLKIRAMRNMSAQLIRAARKQSRAIAA